MRKTRSLVVAAVVAASALAGTGFSHQAVAQVPGSPGQNGFQPIFKPKPKTDAGHKDLAPALPGATPGLGAGPADAAQTDMQPTEALFDAINRGDIAAAKDAISRGAELDGRNILGMTPLELSVDLSRNDITFLLLSLRDAERPISSQLAAASPGATQVSATAGGAVPPKHAVATAAAAKSTHLHVAAAKPHGHAPAANEAAPRLYATRTDPGTPDPQAGFLGFGRAEP